MMLLTECSFNICLEKNSLGWEWSAEAVDGDMDLYIVCCEVYETKEEVIESWKNFAVQNNITNYVIDKEIL